MGKIVDRLLKECPELADPLDPDDVDDVDHDWVTTATLLEEAPIRQHPDGVEDNAIQYQIQFDDVWLTIGRADLCGEVNSIIEVDVDEPLERLRESWIESCLFGARVTQSCFLIIDSATDG